MFVFVTFIVIYIESISVDMLYSYSNVVHLFSFFLNSGTEYASHVNWFCHKSFCFERQNSVIHYEHIKLILTLHLLFKLVYFSLYI